MLMEMVWGETVNKKLAHLCDVDSGCENPVLNTRPALRSVRGLQLIPALSYGDAQHVIDMSRYELTLFKRFELASRLNGQPMQFMVKDQ